MNNPNKWGVFVDYITDKNKKNEIIENFVNDRNTKKFKSLEEIMEKKKRN